jgi:hypothetical protein
VSIGTRLDRLTSALSAKERAILVLRSMKDETPEDPLWRQAMPQQQVREFNRLIGLMNVVNRELALVIGRLAQKTAELQVRESWLVSLILWQEHIAEIRRALRLSLSEPITESEHRRLTENLRAEWTPVDELAAMLAGQHEGWTDADYEQRDDGERELRDEAWYRVCDEKQRKLTALVAAGKLPGKGKARRLKIPFGAFDDLLWGKAGVMPEDYLRYRILPDSEVEAVESEKLRLQRLQGVLAWQPYEDAMKADGPQMPENMIDMLRESMAGMLISVWVQLKTAEAVIAELAGEFGGADPLRPRLREELDETTSELLAVQEHLRFLNMEVLLREPLDEELEEMREWVKERAV